MNYRLQWGISLLICLVATSIAYADVVGWRTDGMGAYPEAQPPTEWSAESNVVWRTPMPNWSNATPVLVGDRIFISTEPTTLVCVRASDGEILWQQTNSYLDTLSPEDAKRVQEQMDAVDMENSTKALREAKDRQGKAKNKLKKTPDDAELAQELELHTAEVERLQTKLAPVAEYMMPVTHDTNGYSSATPVSDGEHVYVVFGTGVVACYDLDGERQWIHRSEAAKHGWGHSASPVLAGNKLLIHINSLMAFDKQTGEMLWQREAKPRWGTPSVTSIAGTDVLITANGDFFQAEDGEPLARELSPLDYAGPLVRDGIVYFVQFEGKAFKLPSDVSAPFEPELVWQTTPRKERYYASSVYHDGLLYAINQRNHFSVIDSNTGEVLHEERLKLGKGTVYPSITLAGSYLFLSSDNGTTLVLAPGPEPKLVATNKLDLFRSSPVFDGKRMYVRTYEYLYCIGG